MSDYKLLIDGELIDATDRLDVINPATGEVLATCPRASEALLNRAVAAAKRAFPAWAALAQSERARKIRALADALEADSRNFTRLLVQEQGKPLFLAEYEMREAVSMLRGIAGMELPVEVLKETPEGRIVEQRMPLGVVAAITPWNFPVILLMVKAAPALTAGNCLVIKPAPTTPLTTLRFGELCREFLPAGVVNVIIDQNDLGGLLTSHPDVAKVAFTGSTATGRKVMASAAATLKRLTLELGGNDAALVLDDVDPREIAGQLFQAAMINSGQVCLAAKRVYVPDALYDDACEALAQIARQTIVADGFAQGVQLGPLQNKAQFDKVLSLIEATRSEGRIIAGGHALERPGYFIAPTIVCDVGDDARIVREEQFGPVLPVLRYSDLDDAIARVNASEYGLGATIWARDLERAYAVAQRLETGTVWVNKHMDLPFDVPFRGAKQSGIGVECGREGLKEFTQGKIINMALQAGGR